MAPKSPQASILEALLINFKQVLLVFESFFHQLDSFLSAPAVGRGNNRKQLTVQSKLNDGCNALHSSVQLKNEQMLMAGQGTVAGRPKASGYSNFDEICA